MSADSRTFETVRSIEADFTEHRWIVEPLHRPYYVGAGLYLMIPVENAKHAEQLKDLVALKTNIEGTP